MTAHSPGASRRLQRLLSEDGYFLVCAIDHLKEFVELLGDPSQVPFAEVVAEKAAVIDAVQDEISAVLIDASYGRKTRAVLLMDTDHVILSALTTQAVGDRWQGKLGEEDIEERAQ